MKIFYSYMKYMTDPLFLEGLDRLGIDVGVYSLGEGNEVVYEVNGKELPSVEEIYKAATNITTEDREKKIEELKREYDKTVSSRYTPTDISLIMSGVGYTEEDKERLIRFVNETRERLNKKISLVNKAKTREDLKRITWE